MSIIVLSEYVKLCRKANKSITWAGLIEFASAKEGI